MSVDALKEFGKKCLEEGEMKDKVKEIGLKNMGAIMSYAKEKGFDFNEDDMKALAKETQSEGELSESDLEQVAGGFVTSTAAAIVGAVAGVAGTVGAGVGVGQVGAAASVSSAGGW